MVAVEVGQRPHHVRRARRDLGVRRQSLGHGLALGEAPARLRVDVGAGVVPHLRLLGERVGALQDEADPERLGLGHVVDEPGEREGAGGGARGRLPVGEALERVGEEPAVPTQGLEQVEALAVEVGRGVGGGGHGRSSVGGDLVPRR